MMGLPSSRSTGLTGHAHLARCANKVHQFSNLPFETLGHTSRTGSPRLSCLGVSDKHSLNQHRARAFCVAISTRRVAISAYHPRHRHATPQSITLVAAIPKSRPHGGSRDVPVGIPARHFFRSQTEKNT